jgi:RNA polymerase sigma-70 factor, ECF subfamily
MSGFVTLSSQWTDWACSVGNGPAAQPKDCALQTTRELEQFLASIERRAFRMAQVSLRNADDALDVVQDAMLKLARHYAGKPSEEWRPLFFRILQNGIRDLQRRHTVRRRLMAWWPGSSQDEEEAPNPVEQVADHAPLPGERLMQGEAMQQLEQALRALPARQREAFMLRNLEGMDVAETAAAMGCTEGSVKTHYSRAVHSLRATLSEVWE